MQTITKFSVLKAALALVLALPLPVSCKQELVEKVDTLTRNTDKISLAYNSSTATFTVRSTGPWSVSSEASWLSFDPVEGTGNGVDYVVITVTASPNTGASRVATIYLQTPGEEPLEIRATQAAGYFELGSLSLGGSFRLNNTPSATLDLPYLKAQGGEKITISATLEGDAAQGLSFAGKEVEIATSGDGTISLPFSGIPTKMGDFTIKATVTYNGTSTSSSISASVFDENTLLYLPASRFPWGGHYVEDLPGIRSVVGEAVGAKVDDETTSCTSGQPGTTDLFRSGMEEFMLARGLKGWAGSKVYEHGNALKIGTGSAGGYLTTPALEGLSETSDILVEFDYARWAESAANTNYLEVVAVDGGEVVGGVLPLTSKEWNHYALTVLGATSKTRISFTTNALQVRGLLRDIEVSVAEDLKEPLAVPENPAGTAYEKSIALSWKAVPMASAYDISLAPAASPAFCQVVRTSKTQYTFENLSSDTEYIAKVRAVYEKNEAMNSEYSEGQTFKTLFVLPSLAKPVLSVYKSERAMVILSWPSDFASLDTRKYSAKLLDASGNIIIPECPADYASRYTDYNRFVFCGLEPSTKYQFCVKRVSTDISQYNDSEWAVLEYTSAPDVDQSGYVFYEDFNDFWIGGQNCDLAFGPSNVNGNYVITSYTGKADALKGITMGVNPERTTANAWTSAFTSFAYLDDYWLKWNYGQKYTEEVWTSEKTVQSMLYPGAGCVKYGSGSANGWIVLPCLKSLTSATDVTVTFDMVPYGVPNASDKELLTISECLKVSGALYSGCEGGASIEGAGSDGLIVFDVKSPKDLGAWKNQTFSFTVKGATAATRIVIASGDKGAVKTGKNRMWLDKVTVVKK